MSNREDEYLFFIKKYFLNVESQESKILALNKSLKKIIGTDESFVWAYDKATNMLYAKNQKVLLEESVLKRVFSSQKSFFNNQVVKHIRYNKKLDNPINMDIKSALFYPIFKKGEETPIGCIIAFCNQKNTYTFHDLDIQIVKLLEEYAKEIINAYKNKYLSSEKIKVEKVQAKELEILSVEVIEDDIDLEKEEQHNVEQILTSLKNDITYLSSKEHYLYTLIETIKNSLHSPEQLHYINKALEKSKIVEVFADSFYDKGRIVITDKVFNPYQAFSFVANLYSRQLSKENIIFNSFISPNLPTSLKADVEQIKSLIIHLLNNILSSLPKESIIELVIEYLEKNNTLKLSICSIEPKNEKAFFSFFTKKVNSNSRHNSGLCLSISSNIIRLLSAKLKLITGEENQHTFEVSIPMKTNELVVKKEEFRSKKPLKIVILMHKSDSYAYLNFRRYLDAFNIKEKDILVIYNYKKLSNSKTTHFFCFENSLTNKVKIEEFPSATILTYRDHSVVSNEKNTFKFNEIYLNSYYGMLLQLILFPDLKS